MLGSEVNQSLGKGGVEARGLHLPRGAAVRVGSPARNVTAKGLLCLHQI